MKDSPIAYRPIKCETCGTSYNVYQPEKHTCHNAQLRALLKEAVEIVDSGPAKEQEWYTEKELAYIEEWLTKAKKILGED